MTETAVIAGVGEGLGAALARRFAEAGYHAVLLARSADRVERIAGEIRQRGGSATALATDITDPIGVAQAFAQAQRDIGTLGVAIFNASMWHRDAIVDLSPEMFERVWRQSCYAGFLVGQQAARYMLPRERGSLFFTGATASLRGASSFSAFAAGKFGLRAVAQSMARELGPKGIHVAHVVIDGIIDTPALHQRFPAMAQSTTPDSLLTPDAIAQTYFDLHSQPRNAWTLELDLRPWSEKF